MLASPGTEGRAGAEAVASPSQARVHIASISLLRRRRPRRPCTWCRCGPVLSLRDHLSPLGPLLLPSSAPPIRFGMSARRRLSGRTAPRCGRRPPRPLELLRPGFFGDGGVVDDVCYPHFPRPQQRLPLPFPRVLAVSVLPVFAPSPVRLFTLLTSVSCCCFSPVQVLAAAHLIDAQNAGAVGAEGADVGVGIRSSACCYRGPMSLPRSLLLRTSVHLCPCTIVRPGCRFSCLRKLGCGADIAHVPVHLDTGQGGVPGCGESGVLGSCFVQVGPIHPAHLGRPGDAPSRKSACFSVLPGLCTFEA